MAPWYRWSLKVGPPANPAEGPRRTSGSLLHTRLNSSLRSSDGPVAVSAWSSVRRLGPSVSCELPSSRLPCPPTAPLLQPARFGARASLSLHSPREGLPEDGNSGKGSQGTPVGDEKTTMETVLPSKGLP